MGQGAGFHFGQEECNNDIEIINKKKDTMDVSDQ
jgi:hypothetical protein